MGRTSAGTPSAARARIADPHLHPDNVFSRDPIWATFPPRHERILQQPTTYGRPDVNTYRDLVFWIEGKDVAGGVP